MAAANGFGLSAIGQIAVNAHDINRAVDFYRGKKELILVTSSSVGGGYDQYSRLIGRYMTKYLPGNPTVIVRTAKPLHSWDAACAKADALTRRAFAHTCQATCGGDWLAVLVAAANAGEGDNRADIGAPMRERARLGGSVERLMLQADGRGHVTRSSSSGQPPVMGGKNAISRAPAIAVSARTCARSIAARITRGFSNACA